MTPRFTTPFAFAPAWLVESGVSDRAVRLYNVLSLYADYETNAAWPKHLTLADKLGCSESSIKRAFVELLRAGAVKRSERRRHDGMQTSNEYVLLLDAPSWAGSQMTPHQVTGEPPGGSRVNPL